MRWADNVVEESTTTTTGAYQLGGVPASGEAPGAQTFVAGIGDAQTCYYYAKEVSGTAWERGIGTVTDAATDTLTRTTIHGSSNAGAAVDWAGKTLRVYCVNPAHALQRMTLDHAGLLDNATFTATRSAGAEAIHLKTLAGTDPSPSDPVRVGFAKADGTFEVLEVTAALSLTLSSGSTGGAVANLPFKVAVLLLNNAGTVALGAAVRPSGISDNSIVSTTAEGGAGAADSPRVIYSASALSDVRARVLGYETYTLTTPGTWDTAPSDVVLTRAGVMEIQVKELLYEKELVENGAFDTNEWWPAGTMPSEYDELGITASLRAVDNALLNTYVYINGDTVQDNYRRAIGFEGSGTGGGPASDSQIGEPAGANNIFLDYFAKASMNIVAPGSGSNKEIYSVSNIRRDATTQLVIRYMVHWENTAPINRLQFVTNGASTNFVAGSKIQIFGLKTASVLM